MVPAFRTVKRPCAATGPQPAHPCFGRQPADGPSEASSDSSDVAGDRSPTTPIQSSRNPTLIFT